MAEWDDSQNVFYSLDHDDADETIDQTVADSSGAPTTSSLINSIHSSQP